MKSHLHIRRKKGINYGEIYTAQRKDGKKVKAPVYLGKVIDLEKNIYYSKKRGYFKYTIENGLKQANEISILDFGSSHLLLHMLIQMEFVDILRSLCPKRADSLLALLF